MLEQLFFHSPFSPATIAQGEGPSLLLQLILRELLKSQTTLSKASAPQLAPFDWSYKHGSFYKVREHAHLLPFAFPELILEAEKFLACLHAPCADLIQLLESFIFTCPSPKLFSFLQKHENSPHIKSILDRMCSNGLTQRDDKVFERAKSELSACDS